MHEKKAYSTEDYTPEPPRPLRRQLPPADPFPMDSLGDVLGAAALGIHDKVQAPPAMCAQSVLAAASLAAQGHGDVVLPTGSVRPLSSYFASIGESGERKTAVDEIALWPVRKREAALRIVYEDELQQHKNEFEAWEKQRGQILGDKRRYHDQASKVAALKELGAAPKAPLVPIITCPEPTFEGLVKLLAQGQPSVGVFTAEGGQFIGSHAMSEDHKLKTISALSSLWDGEPIKRVRQGDGAFVLCGRRVAMHLMVQPGVAAGLLADPVLKDQGILSRMLVTFPPTTAGTRVWKEPAPSSETAIKRYGVRLLDIMETGFPLADGQTNELKPRGLVLSSEARRLWITFVNHIESQIGPGGELEPIRGLANKLAEHAARLAAVLALVDDISCPEVGGRWMAAGINLAQHYAAEALRVFEVGLVDQDLVLAERLLSWLHGNWREPAVSLPDMYQHGPNAIRDAKLAGRLAGILEDHGWLQPVKGGAIIRGSRRREAWRIVKEVR